MKLKPSRGSGTTRFFNVLVVAALSVFLGGLGIYAAFLQDLPDLDGISDYRPALASNLLDRHGQPMGSFYRERRSPLAQDAIPQQVEAREIPPARAHSQLLKKHLPPPERRGYLGDGASRGGP